MQRIQRSGTVFYKSVQTQAYADDIDIIARSRTALNFRHLMSTIVVVPHR